MNLSDPYRLTLMFNETDNDGYLFFISPSYFFLSNTKKLTKMMNYFNLWRQAIEASQNALSLTIVTVIIAKICQMKTLDCYILADFRNFMRNLYQNH